MARAYVYLFLVHYGRRCIVRADGGRRTRALLAAGFLGAVLAPLSLHLVGWDNNRWNPIAIIAAMCCIAIMRLHLAPARGARPWASQRRRWHADSGTIWPL